MSRNTFEASRALEKSREELAEKAVALEVKNAKH